MTPRFLLPPYPGLPGGVDRHPAKRRTGWSHPGHLHRAARTCVGAERPRTGVTTPDGRGVPACAESPDLTAARPVHWSRADHRRRDPRRDRGARAPRPPGRGLRNRRRGVGSDLPTRHRPMENAARSMTFYKFETHEYLRVWQEMDDLDEEAVVIYHSHTATEAYPSRSDITLRRLAGGALFARVHPRPGHHRGPLVPHRGRRGDRGTGPGAECDG